MYIVLSLYYYTEASTPLKSITLLEHNKLSYLE